MRDRRWGRLWDSYLLLHAAQQQVQSRTHTAAAVSRNSWGTLSRALACAAQPREVCLESYALVFRQELF